MELSLVVHGDYKVDGGLTNVQKVATTLKFTEFRDKTQFAGGCWTLRITETSVVVDGLRNENGYSIQKGSRGNS